MINLYDYKGKQNKTKSKLTLYSGPSILNINIWWFCIRKIKYIAQSNKPSTRYLKKYLYAKDPFEAKLTNQKT